jgi:hypothetical protein
MKDINESDWKYLHRIKKTLLDRLCNRILDRIQAECSVQKREPDAHEQYCKIYNFVKNEDKVVADCFDDWRRSTIIFHIIFLIQHQVMTEEEVEQLSDETKQRLKFHLEND